ncbi:hypothetical protein DPSP01_008339 [Paraphaeosphaeria sporulosa]
MLLGHFANQTNVSCTGPLLDVAALSKSGGYTAGRYCSLGSFEDGTTCCFPCPIQDWLYKPNWEDHLRIPNYLSVLSVTLCLFLMLSFAVLPPEATHRHYLSIGLLFSVVFISLSFAIPVTIDPNVCFDIITPHDMHTSQSCAWTGSFMVLGGVGSVVWVFLRSLWLHIRIFWDKDPGTRFMWGSIIFGIAMPFVSLIAVLSVTGLSYRIGQTCLPSHEHAIVTFWIWLIFFAILASLLQIFISGYGFYVYVRSLRRMRRESAIDSFERGHLRRTTESWGNVRRLFLSQWRNILVSVFVIIGSISFFVVFWTQDGKLGRLFNDPNNIMTLKTWIICQVPSMGNKQGCNKYVQDFTVDQVTVLVSLILASLIGISIFILLFRATMLQAWLALFRRLYHRAVHHGRPPTPQLTSLEDADKYQPRPSPKFPFIFRTNTIARSPSSQHRSIGRNPDGPSAGTELNTLGKRLISQRRTSETVLLSPPAPARLDTSSWRSMSSKNSSRAGTPVTHAQTFQPTNVRLSQTQPTSPLTDSYMPSRLAPLPPKFPPSERFGIAAGKTEKIDATRKNELNVRRTPGKVRGKGHCANSGELCACRGCVFGRNGSGSRRGEGVGGAGRRCLGAGHGSQWHPLILS